MSKRIKSIRQELRALVANSLVFVLLAGSAAVAQETRSTILGTVKDTSGAVIAGAAVEITNSETNLASKLTTNDSGYFEAPYLLPGTYNLSVDFTGFKKYLRQGIALAVNTRINIDVVLEVGGTAEQVTVTADVPLLETTSGSGSTSLDRNQLMDLPVANNNAILLARGAPEITWNDPANYLGLHSNVGASQIIAAGGVGGMSFNLDGVPNQAGGRRVGYMPYADTVAEVKIETSPFDASKGRSSGGVINILTKSGTNAYHGTLTWQHWQQRWNATPTVVNTSYWGAIRAAEARGDFAEARRLRSQQKQQPGRSNNWSAVIGGPLSVPRLYNGKGRLFFFFSYTGYRESKSERPQAVVRTVPTEAHRRGDFSDLLKLDPVRYQIYDPRTARQVGGRVVRDPFPNNQVPILNPLYKFYEKLYPLPNNVPGIVTAEGRNNFVAFRAPYDWDYKAFSNRIDFKLSPNQRLFGKWSYNDFLEDRNDFTYETARGLHSNGLVRKNIGITADYVRVLNSSTTLNLAVAYNRFIEGNTVNSAQAGYKPSSVGLPGYLDQKAGDFHLLPRIDFSAYTDISRGYPGKARYSGGIVRGELSKVIWTHGVRSGVDLRENWRSFYSPGNASGSFTFNNNFVRPCNANAGFAPCNNTNSAAATGLEWAAFMLGVPTGISVDTNDSYYMTNRYYSGYVQDDWRVGSRLTLNLGVRYEIDTGLRERYDRGLGAFDPDAELPITAGAQAAFANITFPANVPRLAADQFIVRGGSLFLGKDGSPRTLNDSKGGFAPRAGFAYRLAEKTVVRGGYGIYYDTNNVLDNDVDQFGFNRPTSTIITNDSGLTFLGTNLTSPECRASISQCRAIFADPFPVRADGTRFDTPLGNALGLMGRVGLGFTFVPRDWERARQQRWRLGVQRQLDRSTVVEIAYVGAYTDRISVARRLDPLPEQYWASGMIRNTAFTNPLDAQVANPFRITNFTQLQTSNPTLYREMSNRGFFTSATIATHQLLRRYPHMNGVTNRRGSDGESKFNQLDAVLRRRMSKGIDFQVSYAWASNSDRTFFQNEFDEKPVWRPGPTSPHRFVANLLYQLPFGKGKPLFADKGILRAVLGGWQFGTIFHLQSGRTYDLGNWFFYGNNLRALKLEGKERTLGNWFNWRLLPGASRDYSAADRSAYEARVRQIVPPEVLQQMGNICGPQGNVACRYENVTPNDFRPGRFHRRVFPSRLKWLRTDKMAHWDANLMRSFNLTEKSKLQLRVDLLNALNNVIWAAPNTNIDSSDFARTNTQLNDPRFIQFQFRMTF